MGRATQGKGASVSRVIVRNDILGGTPCISGTRIPAMTIVAEMQAGATPAEILDGYPSLPEDGIDAVRRWAETQGISVDRGAS